MKKYAIYKTETGFYYYEYFDSLEQLSDTVFAGLISEYQLPVVLDGNGGFFHFDENDFNFVKLMETDSPCPLPLEMMYFKNAPDFKLGWMSPEGDTYSCSYTSHTKAAAAIAAKFFSGAELPERTLGKAGWLKIIDSWDGTERTHSQFVYSLTGKITKRQADKLFDLGLYKNEEVRELIKDCENNW
ncbi:MAG: hypothetical protein ACI4J2_04125 [Ruminococcus sp.]